MRFIILLNSNVCFLIVLPTLIISITVLLFLLIYANLSYLYSILILILSCIMVIVKMNCREVSTNLDYSDYEISKEQAKEFAISIFADIKSYIETHQDDYQDFLLSGSIDKTE